MIHQELGEYPQVRGGVTKLLGWSSKPVPAKIEAHPSEEGTSDVVINGVREGHLQDADERQGAGKQGSPR